MSQPETVSMPVSASATTGMGTGSETLPCLVCWEPLSNAGSVYKGAAKFVKEETYRKICAILLLKDLSSLSDDDSVCCPWNFDQDVFPFCKTCFKTFQQLFRLQKNLEQLQRKLIQEVDQVKMNARAKTVNLNCVDLRAVSFRQQFLTNESVNASHSLTRPTNFVNHPNPAFVPDTFIQHRESNVDHNHHQIVTNNISGNYELNYGTGVDLQLVSHPYQNNILHFSPSNPLPYQQSSVQQGTLSLGADGLLDLTQMAEIPSPLSKDVGIRFESEDISGPTNDSDNFAVDDNNYETSDSEEYDANFERRGKKKSSQHKNVSQSSLKFQKSSTTSTNKTKVAMAKGSDMPVEDSDGRMFYKSIEILKNSKGYVCGQCSYTKQVGFTHLNLRKMQYHINGVHLGTYKCDICNKVLSSPSILGEHKRRLHVIGTVDCPICGKPIRNRTNCMKAHLWTHKNAEEKAAAHAAGEVPAEILKDHNRKFNKKSCEVCGKQIAPNSKMKLHLKTHLNNSMKRDIKCPHCEDLFSCKATLRYHVLRRHAEETESTSVLKKFLCLICDKYFTTKAKLNEHNARRHRRNEHKDFQCYICNKRFAINRFLQEHLKDHKPATLYKFQCDVCSVKLVSENSLRNHRKKNHSVIKVPLEKMFADSLAKLISSEANNRINVKDKETRKKCRKDGSLRDEFESFPKFYTTDDGKCSFQGFEVQKLSNNLYKCVTCGFRFSDKNEKSKNGVAEEGRNIKIHIKGVHLGEYTCPYCQLQCVSSLSLSKHKIQKHVLEDCQLCEVCGDWVKNKEYSCHLWYHKSPEDMANAINSGESIPINFKILSLPNPEEIFHCAKCPESFPGLVELNEHRINAHPTNTTKYTRRTSKIAKPSHAKHDSSDEDSDSNISEYSPSISSDVSNADSGEENTIAEDGMNHVFKPLKDPREVCTLTKNAKPKENVVSSKILNKPKFRQQKDSRGSVSSKKAIAKSCGIGRLNVGVHSKSRNIGPVAFGSSYKNASNGRAVQDSKLQHTVAVSLSCIPSVLMSFRSIKYISDEWVSCVSRTGKLQLVALHETNQHYDGLSMEIDTNISSDFVVTVKPEIEETNVESLDYDVL